LFPFGQDVFMPGESSVEVQPGMEAMISIRCVSYHMLCSEMKVGDYIFPELTVHSFYQLVTEAALTKAHTDWTFAHCDCGFDCFVPDFHVLHCALLKYSLQGANRSHKEINHMSEYSLLGTSTELKLAFMDL
jgi:hypothetical protein